VLNIDRSTSWRQTIEVEYRTGLVYGGGPYRKKTLTYDITVCGNEVVTETYQVDYFGLY